MEKLNLKLKLTSYDVFICKDIFQKIGEYISTIYFEKNIIIITDTNVNKLYGDKLLINLKKSGFNPKKIVIIDGEENKNLQTLAEVYDKIVDAGIKRGDLLLAFGGGVVGDLAGFAASTIYRGIKFIQIPTTLLSQVDSSVGGKVAVNTKKGKNLIGSFYNPSMVLIDPNFLLTSNKREFNSGIAEIIKYALISDKEFFNFLLLQNNNQIFMENSEKIIKKCCEIKSDLVEKDEFDMGARMALNFGHTIGHAIEKISNYSVYTHGEAISIGMYEISKLGEFLEITKKGESQKIKKILKQYSLPIESNFDKKELIEIIKNDKKNISGLLNFIFLKEIGKVEFIKIPENDLYKFFN